MTIKIYGMPYSTCTARVLATLAEKEVENYELVPVDLSVGAHKKPDFLKMQPFGMIPVLEDSDLTIYESRAMARYISDKFESQGTPLFGKTAKDKALVNQWLEVESQNYNPCVSSIVYQLVFVPMQGKQGDETVVKQQLEKLEKILDIYEAHLSKNKYLAGDFFSLADLSHIPYTFYLVNVAKKGEGITSRKHVSAWWEDISSRASWKMVTAKMNAKA
jgi:glutathione S-transferase